MGNEPEDKGSLLDEILREMVTRLRERQLDAEVLRAIETWAQSSSRSEGELSGALADALGTDREAD